MKKLLFGIGILVFISSAAYWLFVVQNSQDYQNRRYIQAIHLFQGNEENAPQTQKAIKIWTRLADNGHTPSQCFLGFLYSKDYENIFFKGNILSANPQKALHWLKIAAENGCLLATIQLAKKYNESGDIEKAAYWQKKAKSQNIQNIEFSKWLNQSPNFVGLYIMKDWLENHSN